MVFRNPLKTFQTLRSAQKNQKHTCKGKTHASWILRNLEKCLGQLGSNVSGTFKNDPYFAHFGFLGGGNLTLLGAEGPRGGVGLLCLLFRSLQIICH